MFQKDISRISKWRTLVFLLLLCILPHTSCFTQGDYFIYDLETNSEAKFIKEANSWVSSITYTPSTKYYNCAGNFLLGGYNWSPTQSPMGQSLSRQYKDLPKHTMVKYSFAFWVIDSWDWSGYSRDKFQIQFDDLFVVEGFAVDNYLSAATGALPACGRSDWNDIPDLKAFGWIAHTSSTLSIKFIDTFDEESTNESLGVRDIELIFSNDSPGANYLCGYTTSSTILYNQATCACEPGKYSSSGSCVSCSPECASCYGLGADKCISCADYYYFDGSKCSKCDSSCLECTGPKYNQCTECPPGFALFNGVCIAESRCSSPPFTMDSGPVECYSNCLISSFASWDESCYPPCPNSEISDLSGVCKNCKSLSAQYLKATDDGHQYTFQLSPSSCDLTIENVRRYLSLTEHTVGSVGSFSFQVTKLSSNNYLINLVLDQSILEDVTLDLKLSYLAASLDVPKKFVLDGTLKKIAAIIPNVATGFTALLGGSFVSTLALGATASLWSIVSFQQFVGYFLFINVEYPPVVELFLSMLQVSFWDVLPNPLAALTDSLSVDILAEDKLAVTPYDPPQKFLKYEISSFFVENGGSILATNILLLTVLGLVLLLKRINALEKNIILVKLKIYIKWNIIARAFLENGIPLSLAIFLQLRIAKFDRTYLIICFFLAVVSLLFVCVFIFFFLRILLNRDNKHLSKKAVKRMYGTLYEGIVLSKILTKYYYLVILLRGVLLVCLVTFFEANPVFQIVPLIFFNLGLVMYIFKQVTYEDKKLNFIVKLKEILILFGEIGMLFLCFQVKSERYYEIFGYLVVAFLGIALLLEVVYMIALQICQIKELGRKIKHLWIEIRAILKNNKNEEKIPKIRMRENHRLQNQRSQSQNMSQSTDLIITNFP